MSSFSTFDIASSGIYAQRIRMDVITNNIANAETTRTPDGGPYRRQNVSFASVYNDAVGNRVLPAGVRVDSILTGPNDFRLVHDPGHPDADARGYVKMPNINPIEEMVDLMAASRAYQANITALNTSKTMIKSAIDIGRG